MGTPIQRNSFDIKLRRRLRKLDTKTFLYQLALKHDFGKVYSHLYDDLIVLWSGAYVWDLLAVAIGFSIWLLIMPFTQQAFPLTDYIIAAILIPPFVITVTLVSLIVFLAITVSLNPLREVQVMAVRIMTALQRPFSKETGLGYREIIHLRRIAEIEQGSAEWRSSFVNIVIIGTLSIGIWAAPFIWYMLENGLLQPVERTGSPWSEHYPFLFASSSNPLTILVPSLIMLVIIVWVIVILFRYFRNYLASEVANRTVLQACEEASAFLEAFKLTEKRTFAFREKKAIAIHFGCRIVPAREASFLDKFWTWGNEPDGLIWFLVPPETQSRLVWLTTRLRYMRYWIKRYFHKLRSRRTRNS